VPACISDLEVFFYANDRPFVDPFDQDVLKDRLLIFMQSFVKRVEVAARFGSSFTALATINLMYG
jgi:hypothetical protein